MSFTALSLPLIMEAFTCLLRGTFPGSEHSTRVRQRLRRSKGDGFGISGPRHLRLGALGPEAGEKRRQAA